MDILKQDNFDGVAVLTLNRPDELNALSGSLAHRLDDAIAAAVDDGMRCIVITGSGRAFCSGADLSERLEVPDGSSVLETWYHPLILRLRSCPVPVVAAVNGVAAGAGMSLALLADIVVCAEKAYFLQAFARVGLVPDCGSTWLLARRVGEARARELSLLAEKLDAETARDWGMVNRVVPVADLMNEALAIARKLADGPVNALSGIRMLYGSAAVQDFETQLLSEDAMQRRCANGPEAAEGRTAFGQKRKPDFASIPLDPPGAAN